MSDGLGALQVQLTEALEEFDVGDPYTSAAIFVSERIYPLITGVLAAERQAGRLQGREEAAEAIEKEALQTWDGHLKIDLYHAAETARGVSA